MNHLLFYTLIAVVIGFAQMASALPITVDFANGTSSTGLYSVDVIVTNIPSGEAVAAYNLDVLYNKDRLTVRGIDFNYGLGVPEIGTAITGATWSTAGVFDFWALSLLYDPELTNPEQPLLDWQADFIDSGTLTLATLNFTDTGAGDLNLFFDWYPGQDVKGLDNQIIAGYVPEPGTFLLMGTGLAALVPFRRWRSMLRQCLTLKRRPTA